jgi:hypothetical protein
MSSNTAIRHWHGGSDANGTPHLTEEFLDLVDNYCSGLIDEVGFRRLEAILLASNEARQYFAEYYHFHSMATLAIRSSRATRAIPNQSETSD